MSARHRVALDLGELRTLAERGLRVLVAGDRTNMKSRATFAAILALDDYALAIAFDDPTTPDVVAEVRRLIEDAERAKRELDAETRSQGS